MSNALHDLGKKTRLATLGAMMLLVAPGCGDDGGGTGGSGGGGTGGSGGGGGSAGPGWQVIFDGGDLDRALLSVWGSGPEDVYAVGGPLGNSGFETLVLHFDGSGWRELSPGGTETFWWVGGSGPDDVWMVGEEGRITQWDGSEFTNHDSGVTATIWGVISFSDSDVWAVGGTPEGGTDEPNDIILHYDGNTWEPEVLPGDPMGVSLFKVWGTSSSNLYVVGEQGTIWHRKGDTWELESEPPVANGTLFTVHGCGEDEVYAVGGNNALVSTDGGDSWVDVGADLTNGVNGVSCGSPGDVAMVGAGGLKQRLVDGEWIDEFAERPYSDLHSVWADGEGAFWAVGGDFISKPSSGTPREGVVTRYGAAPVADTFAP